MLVRRRAWLLAMIPTIMLAVARCSSDPPPTQPLVDSGAETGVLGGGVCPDASPEAGSSCNVPEGTTCGFGTCGTGIALCSQGTWRYGGNPPPPPSCPTAFPASDSVCPPCFPASLTCAYGQCDGPDATANSLSASCVTDGGVARWAVAKVECEAGANVQHDAGADSD